jgi:hypothetical protein
MPGIARGKFRFEFNKISKKLPIQIEVKEEQKKILS